MPRKRSKFPRKSICIIGLLIALVVSIGYSGATILQKSSEVSDLKTQVQSLQNSYYELNSNYNSLQASYNTLNALHQGVENQYNILQTTYQVSEALGIGHLLADYYSVVRDSHADYWESPGWWLFGGGEQDKVDFAADLAKHNLGRIYWPDKEDTYYEFADEHSYTTAMRELNEVHALIGIQSGDPSVEKIEKILSFVNTYVHYESDYNNVFLAPVETLAFKSGDCDDYSILVAALFEKAGIDSAIGFFSSGGSTHAMVLIHLDTISPYGFWSYSDLTGKGLSAGKWIIIEPQHTIERQHTPSWFEQWSIRVAAEV